MTNTTIRHDIEVKTIVLTRDENGRPVLIEHRCKTCNRHVTGSPANYRHSHL